MEPLSHTVVGTPFGGSRETEIDSKELLAALMAVRNGDFSARLGADFVGVAGKIADTFNDIVAAKERLAKELERVGDAVGKRGLTRQRVQCERRAGAWGAMETSVNDLIDDLLRPTIEVTRSIAAVAKGDLTQTVPLEIEGRRLEGEFLRSAIIVNRMIEQMSVFTSEVTRVAREVGSEGMLGGQAVVEDVSGVWRTLTDSVNSMAGNLTAQVRSIAAVTIAVADGDLSRKITVDVRGEILQLKEAINTMVDQLRSFASEVTRVAREVGTEGKLGGQAIVPGVAGTWKDLTDNVNVMAGNLTSQVRGIAEVATAIARGDLSRKITVDVKGEVLEVKNTINTMVDQLNSFASEVTRVAREVGTEGKLGGQAIVPGVAGTWKNLTDNVNSMAGNLTAQVRNIAEVGTAVARGDLSRKITVDVKGEILELKNTINVMVDQLNSFASEVTRVAREVGTEGELGGQAAVPGVAGTWKDLTDNVNVMAANLTSQVRNIAEVTTAIARGDLSRKITVDVKGEILELKNTINTVVDQLNSFASEVTRVAREVGTEGRLGGQAEVEGVSGTWKDLTDNVNVMAANLTSQVRAIVKVVTAVADGDLSQKLTFDAKGEVAALADTINGMTDTLRTFGDQVTTVAREVGVEGRLGGQANVPGAAGTWKHLTANVNLLAANLTTQVRAIAEVATAVTKGDLTRSIQVDAKGEVAVLKNYVNAMIGNLRETTERNTQQDWLKTNLAKFSRMLQGQRDLTTVAQGLLSELAPLVEAQQGAMYVVLETGHGRRLRQLAAYADGARPDEPREFAFNEGLIGQCAYERRRLVLDGLPPRSLRIASSLLDLEPRAVVVLPVLFEGQVKAVVELASVHEFTAPHIAFLEQLADIVGVVLNNIEVTMRTELLLEQTQQLAMEQQTQGRELQKTNEELAQKARLLAAQNAEVERKNTEIEQARRAVEEKAAELALTSRYKSEFLANMSHELRTPLNSILVLGQQLADNVDGNLSARQVEFATTIHGAGTDLLTLINDILDHAKVESGTVTLQCEDLSFSDLRDAIHRTFRHETEGGEVAFELEFDGSLPPTIHTDAKRLLQVLKNLLSNAFKFTDRGRVALRVTVARGGWTSGQAVLDNTAAVVAFAVSDTGIGIALDKQKIVFESFQQADAGTARKHGGTGLGLSISRDLAHLLGGEIRLDSVPGHGSTFTLYLPATYAGSTVLPEMEHRGDLPVQPRAATLTAGTAAPARGPAIPDDRADVSPSDRTMLIVEDDLDYAKILLDVARAGGFKGIVATRGDEALALARKQRPSAVCLDIGLPDMLGWAVLGQLKQDPVTRHVPVQVLTGDQEPVPALARGAFAYLTKPVSAEGLSNAFDRVASFLAARKRCLLVVEPDPGDPQGLAALVDHDDLELVTAASGAAALPLLRERAFDCIVVAHPLPDMPAFDLVERSRRGLKRENPPFVIHANRELDAANQRRLGDLAKASVVTFASSPERLLDEASLFLHRDITSLPEPKLRMLLSLQQGNKVLENKKILVVDDDVRNIFALSSVLERYGMPVVAAHTGRDAIRLLGETPDIALVLLDIMMPEMDGYETLRRIRMQPQFQLLPIITLTAKAMKRDREMCLEAGASDYIAKPVDSEHLLSLLRVWLRR